MKTQTLTRENTTKTPLSEENALLKAMLCASPAPTYQKYVEGIEAKEKLHALIAAKRELFPVDDHSEIDAEIRRLKVTVAEHETALMAERIGCYGYQILSNDPFTWRNKMGLPLLAPFSLDSNTCNFFEERFGDQFPHCVRVHYEDILRNLRLYKLKLFCKIGLSMVLAIAFLAAMAGGIGGFFIGFALGLFIVIPPCRESHRQSRVSCEASLGGIIPNEIKEEIRRALRSGFFEDVFILAEVKHWAMKKKVVLPIGDPLVIGYDGTRFWLIAVFDTTSLEQFVANNHAVTTN